jgi:hypothetical protein
MATTTTTFNVEYHASVAPEKMFKAIHAEAVGHHPNLMPQIIKSVEHDPSGLIRKTTYVDGSHLTLKIDHEDHQNLTAKYTVIHGEMKKDDHDTYTVEWKFVPSGNGGTLIKIKGEGKAKAGSNFEADHTEDKEQLTFLCKQAEEHLIKAN